jgi:Protein of unknown function (DUF1501)
MSTPSRYIPNPTPCGRSRREFLWQIGGGFAGLALLDLLGRDGVLGAPKPTHFAAKAKHAVFLFMNGAPSQVDTFDPKPALSKFEGTPYKGDTTVGSNGRPIGHLMQSPFPFTKHGQSGLPISSLFPHTAKFADDLCVLRAMYTDTAAHASGCLQMNTGSVQIGKPSLGSWLSYGLGTLTDNLPSFVVMTDPRGGPIGSASNWTAGFMPAAFQGTLLRSQGSPLLDLATPPGVTPEEQKRSLALLAELNRQHMKDRPGESELAARIQSYELAFHMQTAVPEVLRFSDEDESTRRLYGLDHDVTRPFGQQLLAARRLSERGVRFIQVFHGEGAAGAWDAHTGLRANHSALCAQVDRPIAGLLIDLKRRGLLDETIVVWATEFGRTPCAQGADGRDHHNYGFSVWLAGGGIQGGLVHGATDELGFHAVENRHYVTDIHATILHLLGIDSRRIEIPGRKRLEVEHGRPIREILA